MKKILFTGPFRYPNMDAGGKRVFTLVQSLKHHMDVDVTCWDECAESQLKNSDGKIVTKDFLCLSDNKVIRGLHYLFLGRKTLRRFNFNFNFYDIVVLYNPPFIFSLIMCFLSKIQKFEIVVESNEWYESEHLPGGKFGLAALENFARMNFSYLLFKKFIVMSDYMADYYLKYNKMVCKIPPLAERVYSNKKLENSALNLMYAGSPGKKDRVDEIVDCYLSLDSSLKEKLKVTFIGFTYLDFLKLYPKYKDNEAIRGITFLGRKSMSFVSSYYDKVDYVIFFREDKRYAKAGFPSKFVESLSHNTPIITNPVGDISSMIEAVGFAFNPAVDDFSFLINKAINKKRTFGCNISKVIDNNFQIDKNLCKLLKFLKD